MKTVILARVSTTEQKEAGNSLPAQHARLLSYVKGKPDLELTREFIFDESAYKEHRKEFKKIVDYILSFREIVALCCDKVDRLTRDFLVGLPELEKLRRDGKIELHFPSDNLVLRKDSPATDLFHFNIAVSLAQYYSNAISDNVKRGNEQLRLDGKWNGKAPVGYTNVGDSKETRNIIVDEQKAHNIRKIFEMYATGNYSLHMLRNETAKAGLLGATGKPLSVSMISHILKNPFYYGEARYKGTVTYPHRYEPLITRELFQRCQEVCLNWNKKPFQYAAIPFVFRGLLTCSGCGGTMSPENKKGKHTYYSCTNYRKGCKRVYVTEKQLLEPIYEVLGAMSTIPQKTIDDVVADLKRITENKGQYHKHAVAGLQVEYNETQTKVDRLVDLLADGSITKDVYDRKLQQSKERQYEINSELELLTRADESFHATAGQVLSVAKRSMEIFTAKEAKTNEKRALVDYLLENGTVKGRQLNYKLRAPFNVIFETAQAVKLEMAGQPQKHLLELTKTQSGKGKSGALGSTYSTWQGR